jgi:hypothetical protein
MKREKDKTLTTRFPTQTMVEFSVAADLLGFRSINALVHQLVMQKIREAKSLVAPEEFERLVEAQKKETLKRSKIKSKERLEMLGELVPDVEERKRAA